MNKFTCLLALLAFVGATGMASAAIQGNGTLLVDLRSTDFTTGTTATTWINHGAGGLGNFVSTSGTLVVAHNFSRGLFFDDVQRGFLCSSAAPSTLLGDHAFTCEMWIWSNNNATNTFAKAVGGWGDRPGGVMEFDFGGGPSCLVTYQNGDHSFTSLPSANAWHYVVWTHTGDGTVVSPADSDRVYVDGVLNTSWSQTYSTNSDGAANDNPVVPISVGAIRVWNNPGGSWDVGGQNGGFAFSTRNNASIAQVRIWDGPITEAQQANNFLLERPNYVAGAFVPPAPSISFRRPVSPQAIELGDHTAIDPAVTTPIDLVGVNTSFTSPVQITGYSITGPQASKFALSPASPATGPLANGAHFKFSVIYTPDATAQTSASLVINTSVGNKTIWLRANVPHIYVDFTNGNDANPGTQASPIQTLGHAFTLATLPGSVIQLASAVYPSFGAVANANRVLRITAPNGAVINLTNNNRFTANTPNTQTFVFENITTVPFSAGGFTALGVTGTGNCDVTYRNCNLDASSVGPGGRAAGNNSTFSIGRFFASNSRFFGGPSGNLGVLFTGNDAELTAINCDFTGCTSGIQLSSTVVPTTVTLSGCKFGTNGITGALGLNINGAALASGSNVLIQNCTFDGFTDSAIGGFATDASFNVSNTGFAHVGTGADIYNNVGGTERVVTLTDCNFSSSGLGAGIYMSGGNSLSLTGCTFTDNSGVPVFVDDSGTTKPTAISVVRSELEGGHDPVNADFSSNNDVPALEVVQAGAAVTIDRSSLHAGKLLASFGNRVTTQTLSVNAPASVSISNSVIEGGQVGANLIGIGGSPAPSSVKFYNNTMVATANSPSPTTAIGLSASFPADVQNNIILGWNAVTSKTLTLPTNNMTTGDPLFVNPTPFAVPATVSVSNYHLQASSPAIGVATNLGATYKLDRDNVDRSTFTAWDLGAYQFNPAPNPVKPGIWTWF